MKSATGTLEPIAIEIESSVRSFNAALTAVACSAASPTIATTRTPTKDAVEPGLTRGWRDRRDHDLAHPRARRSPPRTPTRRETRAKAARALPFRGCVDDQREGEIER